MFRAQYTEDSISTTVRTVRLATATAGGNTPAFYVEQCRCPRGYTGLSCEVKDPYNFVFVFIKSLGRLINLVTPL